MFLDHELNDVIFIMMAQQSPHNCHLYLNSYHCKLAKLTHQLILVFIRLLLEFTFFQCSCLCEGSTSELALQTATKHVTVATNQQNNL